MDALINSLFKNLDNEKLYNNTRLVILNIKPFKIDVLFQKIIEKLNSYINDIDTTRESYSQTEKFVFLLIDIIEIDNKQCISTIDDIKIVINFIYSQIEGNVLMFQQKMEENLVKVKEIHERSKKEKSKMLFQVFSKLCNRYMNYILSGIICRIGEENKDNIECYIVYIQLLTTISNDHRVYISSMYVELINAVYKIMNNISTITLTSQALCLNELKDKISILILNIVSKIIDDFKEDESNKETEIRELKTLRLIYNLLTIWSKDYQSKNIINSLIVLGAVIEESAFIIYSMFIFIIKKEPIYEIISTVSSFRKFIEFSKMTNKKEIEINLNDLYSLLLLIPEVSPNVIDFDENRNRLKNEIFLIFLTLNMTVEKTLLHLLQKSNGNTEKLTSIYTMKVIILLSNVFINNDLKSSVIDYINRLTKENDLEIKYALIELMTCCHQKQFFNYDLLLSFYFKKEKDINQVNELNFLVFLFNQALALSNEASLENNDKSYPFNTTQTMIKERSIGFINTLIPHLKIIVFRLCLSYFEEEVYFKNDFLAKMIQILFEKYNSYSSIQNGIKSELNILYNNTKILYRLLLLNDKILINHLLPYINSDLRENSSLSTENIIKKIHDKEVIITIYSYSIDELKRNKSNSFLIRLIGSIIFSCEEEAFSKFNDFLSILYNEYKNSCLDFTCQETVYDYYIKTVISEVIALITSQESGLRREILMRILFLIRFDEKSSQSKTNLSIISYFSKAKTLSEASQFKSQLILSIGKIVRSCKEENEIENVVMDNNIFEILNEMYTKDNLLVKEACVKCYFEIFCKISIMNLNVARGMNLNEFYYKIINEYKIISIISSVSVEEYRNDLISLLSVLIKISMTVDLNQIKSLFEFIFDENEKEEEESIKTKVKTEVIRYLFDSVLSHQTIYSDKTVLNRNEVFVIIVKELIIKKFFFLIEHLLDSARQICMSNEKILFSKSETKNWMLILIELIDKVKCFDINSIFLRIIPLIDIDLSLLNNSNKSNVYIYDIVNVLNSFSNDLKLYFIDNLIKKTQNQLSISLLNSLLILNSDLIHAIQPVIKHMILANNSSSENSIYSVIIVLDNVTNINMEIFLESVLDSEVDFPFQENLIQILKSVISSQEKIVKTFNILVRVLSSQDVSFEKVHKVMCTVQILSVLCEKLDDNKPVYDFISNTFYKKIFILIILSLSTIKYIELLNSNSLISISYQSSCFDTVKTQILYVIRHLLVYLDISIKEEVLKGLFDKDNFWVESIFILNIYQRTLNSSYLCESKEILNAYLNSNIKHQRHIALCYYSNFIDYIDFTTYSEKVREVMVSVILSCNDSNHHIRKVGIVGVFNFIQRYIQLSTNVNLNIDSLFLNLFEEGFDLLFTLINDTSDEVVSETLYRLLELLEVSSSRLWSFSKRYFLVRILKKSLFSNNLHIKLFSNRILYEYILYYSQLKNDEYENVLKDVNLLMFYYLINVNNENYEIKLISISIINLILKDLMMSSYEISNFNGEKIKIDVIFKTVLGIISRKENLLSILLNTIDNYEYFSINDYYVGNVCLFVNILLMTIKELITFEEESIFQEIRNKVIIFFGFVIDECTNDNIKDKVLVYLKNILRSF